eukprot:TRINITY_DN2528_c0_g2_i1.p3 TRINITY_DN2528_c0_g2~~TRINITY_DN2528_c0_g2_i1.p3  ORF type:complete len:103 (+),score=12.24 TRINITY_DN2528_c0_g2_i1:319-627(+)
MRIAHTRLGGRRTCAWEQALCPSLSVAPADGDGVDGVGIWGCGECGCWDAGRLQPPLCCRVINAAGPAERCVRRRLCSAWSTFFRGTSHRMSAHRARCARAG